MFLFRLKEAADALMLPFYLLSGRRPWGLGYYTARKQRIVSAIDSGLFKLERQQLPSGYGVGMDERVVEYPWLFSRLGEDPGVLLDAGSALNHAFLLSRKPLRDSKLTIMTLAPEKRCFWHREISYVFGDLRDTCFRNGCFDVIVSISTIEHIGLDNTLLYTSDESRKEMDVEGFVPAIREFRRLLNKGGRCYITVPYGRRGVHGWYQVFDAGMVAKIVEVFAPSAWSAEYYGYDARGWRKVEPEMIAEAEFFDIHENRTIPEDKAAGARGVACLRLVV